MGRKREKGLAGLVLVDLKDEMNPGAEEELLSKKRGRTCCKLRVVSCALKGRYVIEVMVEGITRRGKIDNSSRGKKVRRKRE
jgi:hypothetical protein